MQTRSNTRAIQVLVSLVSMFAFGVGFGYYEVPPFEHLRSIVGAARHATGLYEVPSAADPYGRWHPARSDSASDAINDETISQLVELGYLSGYETAGSRGGVTMLDPNRVQPGLTLFCSGHAPIVRLVSLTGEVVHEWQTSFESVWPDGLPFVVFEDHKQFIRRAWVFPNGDLLALFEYTGLVKLDKNSNVIWKHAVENHHDFVVEPDGTIVSLARRWLSEEDFAAQYRGFGLGRPEISDDLVIFLDAEGNELRRISLIEAFSRSDYAAMLLDRKGMRDVLHTNSVAIVDNWRDAEATHRELLISMRDIDAVATVSIEEQRVTWALRGPWRRQHQASILPNNHLLLLDNQGGNAEWQLRFDQSEVIEIDLATGGIAWRYRGDEQKPFYTQWLGYVERLENGNTFITESTAGRILEVTPEGEIVWEYVNPERTGAQDELIATLMGGRRISSEAVPFLEPDSGEVETDPTPLADRP